MDSPPLPPLPPLTNHKGRRFTGLTIEVPPAESSTSECDFDNVSILSNVTEDEEEEPPFDDDDDAEEEADAELTPEEEERETLEQIRALDERVAASRRRKKEAQQQNEKEPDNRKAVEDGAQSLLSALLDDDKEPAETPVTPTTEYSHTSHKEQERGHAWEDLMNTWQSLQRPSVNSAPATTQRATTPLPKRSTTPLPKRSTTPLPKRSITPLQPRPKGKDNEKRPAQRKSLIPSPRQRISAPEPGALRKLASTKTTTSDRGELWQDLVSQWSTLRT